MIKYLINLGKTLLYVLALTCTVWLLDISIGFTYSSNDIGFMTGIVMFLVALFFFVVLGYAFITDCINLPKKK